MKSLNDRHEDAAIFVLDNNVITPEELGGLLFDASDTPGGITFDQMRTDQRRIAGARKKLLELNGGKELYKLQVLVYEEHKR